MQIKSTNKIKVIPQIINVKLSNLSSFLNSIITEYENLFYFSNPIDNYEFIALGKIFSSNYDLNELENEYSNLYELLDFKFNEFNINKLPIVIGYHKFPSKIIDEIWSDFKDSEWIIPQYIFLRNKDATYLINFFDDSNQIKLEQLVEESNFRNSTNSKFGKLYQKETDDFVKWKNFVSEAIDLIKNGRLSKIVVSRKKQFKLLSEIDYSGLFETINKTYPDCFNFLIKSNNSIFFGSTPELLVQLEKNRFKSEALAGSIRRGLNDYEDKYYSELLLSDKKNLLEHQIVVDYLQSQLSNIVTNFYVDDKPKIKKLRNIQHLNTEVFGEILPEKNIFHIIKTIFPTPAVCGIPKQVALDELANIERFERGIFTGILGWLNFNSQAEFCVALRCGLVYKNYLTAFAGCGIVENSVDIDEFNETELKINSIIDFFDVEY
ncbi:MAG: isochorismate synthase [Ignavibacterium sp.]|nr:isochorismate synthase [Ignavibacterium sp.]MDW8376281.1 isochorismate synthase [Ignavibacteriales bacterium]